MWIVQNIIFRYYNIWSIFLKKWRKKLTDDMYGISLIVPQIGSRNIYIRRMSTISHRAAKQQCYCYIPYRPIYVMNRHFKNKICFSSLLWISQQQEHGNKRWNNIYIRQTYQNTFWAWLDPFHIYIDIETIQ